MLARAFDQVGQGDYEGVVRMLAARFEHSFAGHHALGGTRRTPAAARRWGERLFKIFPGIQFRLGAMVVAGWPWLTRAAVEWVENNRGPDGVVNENSGVHLVELRWGRISRIAIFTDTALLAKNLARLETLGVVEAGMPPITDADVAVQLGT
jgi:ketosteroid isomerase-like protein